MLKKYFIKKYNTHYLLKRISILIFCLSSLNIFYIKGYTREKNLTILTKECLSYGKRNNCKDALIELESLQLKESSNRNYSCQTRLLGLQADLIIVMHSLGRRFSQVKTIEEVKKHCPSF